MEPSAFKSPRAIQKDIIDYERKRFEDYMTRVDAGELTQAIALAALREEIDYRGAQDAGEKITDRNNQVSQGQ